MKTPTQQKAEEALESIVVERRPEIPEQLKRMLMRIPDSVQFYQKTVPMKAIWLAAAGLALLITVNAVVWMNAGEQQTSTAMYTNYFSYLEQL